jgi:sugar phosphate isomerase/epimerase
MTPADGRFGLSTHLFHTRRLERDDLARIRDAGFPLVEVFATRTHVDYHDRAHVEVVREWIEALGLRTWGVHLPITDGVREGVWGRPLSNASTDGGRRGEALRETTAAIAAAGILGAQVAVLHLGVPEGQQVLADDNDERAASGCLEPIAAACASAGVRLALEVIPNRLSTATAVLAWLRGDLDLGQTGACLDVGHAHMIGGVVDAIDTLSGDVITTHIHDNAGTADDHLIPFDGTIEWPAALFALAKVGYTGPFVFELPDHGDVSRTLARAAAARSRFQAILDELLAPFPFED